MAAVAEQPPESVDVRRRRDDQDLPDPRQHQRGQRVVDHRLVVNRQELLGHNQGERVEAGAGPAGKKNSLHLASEFRTTLPAESKHAGANLPVLGPPDGPENVRYVADTAERHGEVETRVLLDADAADLAQIDELVLGRKTAALRVVVAGDSMLRQRLVLHVPVERVRDAVSIVQEAQIREGVEVVRLPRHILSQGPRAEPHVAPAGQMRHGFAFPPGLRRSSF